MKSAFHEKNDLELANILSHMYYNTNTYSLSTSFQGEMLSCKLIIIDKEPPECVHCRFGNIGIASLTLAYIFSKK